MTTSSSGSVKWSQVSDDLVPVNINCIQESDPKANGENQQSQNVPQMVFHVTAYSQVNKKILDVRLVQPGD